MTARNIPAWQHSQAVRADICALLDSRSPRLPRPSAKAVKSALRLTIGVRQVRRHLAGIYAEAELAELGVRCGRVSSADVALG